jgi:hypothetical protein
MMIKTNFGALFCKNHLCRPNDLEKCNRRFRYQIRAL